MKYRNNKIGASLILLIAIILTGCLKKIDVPNINTINVSMNSGTNFVTTDLSVNPKDSIIFSFTVTCNTPMKYVGIQKNATDNSGTSFLPLTKDTLNSSNNQSYTITRRLAADSVNGVYKYRITALDSSGYYLGSSKEFVITINPDFVYYTLRFLQVPDSTAKTNKCYFSSGIGQSFSYADGPTNSASIDFGYFYDTTRVLAGSPAVLTPKGSTIYALNNTITPFTLYDMTGWTKNPTPLKLSTSVTFASITSGGALYSAGVAALTTGAATRVSTTDRAAALISSNLTGAVILFKNMAGKYGAMTVNYTYNDSTVHDSYINLDVKVQK